MMDKYCCGFGHRDCYVNVKEQLREVIERLINEQDITIFLTGGMGEFDSEFSAAVRTCKSCSSKVKLVLVKPYFSNELNTNKEYYEYYYDDIIIPDIIAGSHYKSAITKRNRWMVDRCDAILSGVYRESGGAYDAIKYAKRKEKPVIELIKK